MCIRDRFSTVEDPAVSFLSRNLSGGDRISSEVPVVDVREIDSVLKVKSGKVMVVGGLMEERTENQDSGLPYLSDIPFFGNAFKTVDKKSNIVQTVIFLKSTIVPSQGVEKYDQQFYNTFSNDPRPFKF